MRTEDSVAMLESISPPRAFVTLVQGNGKTGQGYRRLWERDCVGINLIPRACVILVQRFAGFFVFLFVFFHVFLADLEMP